MRLSLSSYKEQSATWPSLGNHILAQYDERAIVVYQAYSASIAEFATGNQRFGGQFSFKRMSWIKPNFLWMMYRSGWATKSGQERVLAVRIDRSFFDSLLALAVETYYRQDVHGSVTLHQAALASSPVRVQWDPDHDPRGRPLVRRAIQLGLKGETLRKYATEAITEVEDVTEFVREQHPHAQAEGWHKLLTPSESVYRPSDPETCRRLRLD